MNYSKKIILKALGNLVRQKRKAHGLSQEELGFRSNLDRTYVSGVERGIRNISFTALVSLANGLGLTISELLENFEIEVNQLT